MQMMRIWAQFRTRLGVFHGKNIHKSFELHSDDMALGEIHYTLDDG